jgi:hypothetical protein
MVDGFLNPFKSYLLTAIKDICAIEQFKAVECQNPQNSQSTLVYGMFATTVFGILLAYQNFVSMSAKTKYILVKEIPDIDECCSSSEADDTEKSDCDECVDI